MVSAGLAENEPWGVFERINVKSNESVDNPSDEDLMVMVKNGDQVAFGELMNRYEGRLYNYLKRITKNTADAEDIYQEAFLKVYRHAARFNPDGSFRPWLYRIATNLCMDLLRKKTRRKETSLETGGPGEESALTVQDLSPSPADVSQRRERQAALAEAVEELPDKQRTVFLLARYEGLPYAEISDVLEVPLGTVKSRMNTAVNTLMKRLNEENA
jgi:RNA polymerase sigma-70 factor (ECF subfamily)